VWGSNNAKETCMDSLIPEQQQQQQQQQRSADKRDVDAMLPPFTVVYPPVNVAPVSTAPFSLPPDLLPPQPTPAAPPVSLPLVPWRPNGGLSGQSIREMGVSATPVGKALPTLNVDGVPVSAPDVDYDKEFAVFVTTSGQLWTCGGNYWAQRGVSSPWLNSTSLAQPTRVDEFDATRVKQVAMGTAHALLVLNDSKILAFGRNDEGQLGLGFANWTRSGVTSGLYKLDSVLGLSNYDVRLVATGSYWSVATYPGEFAGPVAEPVSQPSATPRPVTAAPEVTNTAPQDGQKPDTDGNQLTVAVIVGVVILILIAVALLVRARMRADFRTWSHSTILVIHQSQMKPLCDLMTMMRRTTKSNNHHNNVQKSLLLHKHAQYKA
jgi:hypothetical protein